MGFILLGTLASIGMCDPGDGELPIHSITADDRFDRITHEARLTEYPLGSTRRPTDRTVRFKALVMGFDETCSRSNGMRVSAMRCPLFVAGDSK